MIKKIKKFVVYSLVGAVAYGHLPVGALMAQGMETVQSVQLEIDTLKNQVLKLQADVYTKEENSEDPGCGAASMTLASIESQILTAETRAKGAKEEVERKRAAKKKLLEELAFYDRMFLNAAEKTAIFGVIALAGAGAMIAMGLSNKKIQDRLDKGDYSTDGANCIGNTSQISIDKLSSWESACRSCCLKTKEDQRTMCVSNCEHAKSLVMEEIKEKFGMDNPAELQKKLETDKKTLNANANTAITSLSVDYAKAKAEEAE